MLALQISKLRAVGRHQTSCWNFTWLEAIRKSWLPALTCQLEKMFAAAAWLFRGGLFLSPPAVLPLEPWKKLLSTSTTWSAKIDCSSRRRRWPGFFCGRCRRSLLTCCCCWSMVAGSSNSFAQKELQAGGKNCSAIIGAPPRCQQCSSIAYKITSYFELSGTNTPRPWQRPALLPHTPS